MRLVKCKYTIVGLLLILHIGNCLIAPSAAAAKSAVEDMIPVPQKAPIKPASIIKAAVPNERRLVLKNGKHFLVMNESGLLPYDSSIGCGLYSDDTRYLSQWDILLNGEPLTLLSADTDSGYAGKFIYGNKASGNTGEERRVPEQSIVLERNIVITDALREQWKITNFGTKQVELTLAIKYSADFADMFEVRGAQRKKRGELLGSDVDISHDQVILTYQGLDHKLMKTIIAFGLLKPIQINGDMATFKLVLPAKHTEVLETAVATNFEEPIGQLLGDGSTVGKQYSFDAQLEKSNTDYQKWCAQGATVTTDNAGLNHLLDRSLHDLYMLRQETPRGECLAAGIPWYTVAFGRDQAITGKETLPLLPNTSREILKVLASYQGTKYDDYTAEEPGKMMHELRLGEMARLREIPFIPYYGSVDVTPLWLCLLADYVDWTGDLDLAKSLWPNVQGALAYLDRQTTDSSYLTYGKKSGQTLSNQGWKDSGDSIMYESGELAKPPIALAEVQAYLYDAWKRTAHIALLIGQVDLAKSLVVKADKLKQHYDKDFWEGDKKYVCLALDGDGKQCQVSASNPGHDLATGILTNEQNADVADKLLSPAMFAGWGIRTLSSSERAYNPISYHNGSIWPHDNALIVQGLCAIGRVKDAVTVFGGIVDAGENQPEFRLPELYCGFDRSYSPKPVWYPVSCAPQSWSEGSLFLMLDSLLGLKADALNNKLYIVKPTLPSGINHLTIKNLQVGKSSLDLDFVRQNGKVQCKPLRKAGTVSVVVQ
jgi:glycogen debranching enzyme